MNFETYDLDLSGLECPLPILKTKKKLNEILSGDIINIICTDPGSQRDFEAFARQTGHQLIESKQESNFFQFKLKKKLLTLSSWRYNTF